MDMSQILDVVISALAVIFAALTYYLKSKTDLKSQITKAIADAEAQYYEAEKAGKLKMLDVVDTLYDNYVPVFLRPFITKETVQDMAQAAWEEVEKYGKLQVGKATAEMEKQIAEINERAEQTLAELEAKTAETVKQVTAYTEEYLSTLKKIDLTAIADKLGIAYDAKDTKAIISAKIIESQKTE